MTKVLPLPTASFISFFLLGIFLLILPQVEAQAGPEDILGAATGQAEYLRSQLNGSEAASAWLTLADRARFWARLEPAGTLTHEGCDYTLQVAETRRTVVTLSAAELEASCRLTLSGQTNAPVLINVLGSHVAWPAPRLVLGDIVAEQLLFNFPETTSLEIGAGQLAGTVLAPFAQVNSHALLLHGSLIATDMTGDLVVEAAPFAAALTLPAFDFGDLPETAAFGTMMGADGARHAQSDTVLLFLGQDVDTEPDGQPDVSAWGDGRDEMGVEQRLPWVDGPAGGGMDIMIGAGEGCLNGWFDLNENGQFDPDEHLLDNMAVSAAAGGRYQVAIDLPAGTILNPTLIYARFRLTPQDEGLCQTEIAPTGYAFGGEVEDYFWPSNPEPTAVGWSSATAMGLLQSPLLPALLLVSIMTSIMMMVGITVLKGRESRKLRQ